MLFCRPIRLQNHLYDETLLGTSKHMAYIVEQDKFILVLFFTVFFFFAGYEICLVLMVSPSISRRKDCPILQKKKNPQNNRKSPKGQ